eukprot:CAMPEP_0116833606 /NCGR_PEP_ID=MMETSP0418-20121206/6529_1 /TAXON_ID=1158023 /ORGANISM="Astrosyne radiata, Strain 13vi08-1A" /LENGTH=494 /DNA_ID=CAMNT_0004463073 /DNA_START=488 /DNA_END=1972 /DNA_ORIENTATION=+
MQKTSTSDHLAEDVKPSETDVLFGRDKVMFNHIGNIRFRLVIQSRAKEYENAPSRREKSGIVYSVVQKVHSYGGRFLRKEKDGSWRIVTVTEAIQKVGHALRDKKQHELRIRRQGKQSKSMQRNCDMLFKLGEVCSNEMKTMEVSNPDGTEATPDNPGSSFSRDSTDTTDEKPKNVAIGHQESEEERCAKTILEMQFMSSRGNDHKEKDEVLQESREAGRPVTTSTPESSRLMEKSVPVAEKPAPKRVKQEETREVNAALIAQARQSMNSKLQAVAESYDRLNGVAEGYESPLASVNSILRAASLPPSSRQPFHESLHTTSARQAALALEQAELEERSRLEAVNRELDRRAATLSLLAYQRQMQQQADAAEARQNLEEAELQHQLSLKRRASDALRSVAPPSEVLSEQGDGPSSSIAAAAAAKAGLHADVLRAENALRRAETARLRGSDGLLIYPLSLPEYRLPSASGWKLALMPVNGRGPPIELDPNVRFSSV